MDENVAHYDPYVTLCLLGFSPQRICVGKAT
jgi:hypothetical protein